MKRLLWLLPCLLIALLIPFLLGGSDMWQRLASFPSQLLLAMLGMILLCWLLNAMRLRLLLAERARQLGRIKSIGVVMATEFAICATPGGTGGPLTLMALLARNGIRPARSSALFAIDQLNDLLFFFCAFAGILLYGLFHRLTPNLENMLGLSAVLLLTGFAAIIALARYHRALIRGSGHLLARLKVRRARRIHLARKLLHFRDALRDSLNLPRRRLALIFLLTSAHWGLRFSVLYLALYGLGADIQWAWTFLIQMLALSAGQLSLLPGGVGGTELTSAALLAPLVGKSTAAAAILIWRAITYYFYLLAGGPAFLLLAGRPFLRRLMRLRGG